MLDELISWALRCAYNFVPECPELDFSDLLGAIDILRAYRVLQ